MKAVPVFLTLCAAGAAVARMDDVFSVVLIPDTQFYSDLDPETYRKQTQFIADSQAALNIRAAIHLGDITDRNTMTEWWRASVAHRTLEHRYSVQRDNRES